MILITLFIIGGNFKSVTSANSGNIIPTFNSRLQYENDELKKNYAILEKRMAELEGQLHQVIQEDNMLYSNIVGIAYDTTDIYDYRNDSVDYVFTQYDTIFNKLNQRSLYTAELLALHLERLTHTSEWFKNNKYVMSYYPTISPVKTQDFIYVSSPYGMREDPINNKPAFHEGIDISANVGSPVYATASGTVVKIMYSKYGYGNRILIKHNYGFETLYAHLSDRIVVKKGQWVNKNQLIGSVGNSGKSTGPHLHYEIHKNGNPRDPMGYFYTHLTDELLAMN